MGIDPVRGYEYLFRARQKLLGWIRPLSASQYAMEFPIGLRTIRNCLVHVAGAEWTYNRRLRGEVVPTLGAWPLDAPGLFILSVSGPVLRGSGGRLMRVLVLRERTL